MELKETVDLMLSDDYKERFTAEYRQLRIRCQKLADFINKAKNDELDFELSCPIELLDRQLHDMLKYASSLEMRAVLEDIHL